MAVPARTFEGKSTRLNHGFLRSTIRYTDFPQAFPLKQREPKIKYPEAKPRCVLDRYIHIHIDSYLFIFLGLSLVGGI